MEPAKTTRKIALKKSKVSPHVEAAISDAALNGLAMVAFPFRNLTQHDIDGLTLRGYSVVWCPGIAATYEVSWN